jgi:hypothetical protein
LAPDARGQDVFEVFFEVVLASFELVGVGPVVGGGFGGEGGDPIAFAQQALVCRREGGLGHGFSFVGSPGVGAAVVEVTSQVTSCGSLRADKLPQTERLVRRAEPRDRLLARCR